MELNLEISNLLGFYAMVCLVTLTGIVTGTKLLRLIAWMALWQLLTPTRSSLLDIPLLFISFVIVEKIYLAVTGLVLKKHG